MNPYISSPHPTPSGDLFTGLWQAAHWIWNRRAAATRTAFPFSEETITETVLLDLATAHPESIAILPLNKRQEGKVGADWEWCFYDSSANKFLRMLVQAKVLDDKEDAYSHLDRIVGNTGERQIDLLDRVSRDREVPAFYVFYNHISDHSRLDSTRCPCISSCYECWGATVAPLGAVLADLPFKTFDRLQPFMTPWACLLCSPAASANPLTPDTVIDRVFASLGRLYSVGAIKSGAVDSDVYRSPRIEKQAPDYFEMARQVGLGKAAPRKLIEEISRTNPDLDGVVLINTTAIESSPEKDQF